MFRRNTDALDAHEAKEVISEIGADLLRIRTTRGERLEDVAEYLGIKSIYLYGIEQGDLSVIPHRRNIRSYTSSYANYMGLDGDAITDRLQPVINCLEGAETSSRFWFFSNLDRNSTVILASSIVLGIVAGWFYLGDTSRLDLIAAPVTAGAVGEIVDSENGGNNDTASDAAAETSRQSADDEVNDAKQALASLEDQIAKEQGQEALNPRPEDQLASNQPTTANQQQTANETAPKEAIPSNVLATLVAKQGNGAQIYEAENTDARVIVRALDTSWIQVSSADRSYLWTRTMQPREMLLVPNREDLELWAGDANSVEILLDGVVLPTLGPPGTVVRGLSLAPASLEALSQTVSREGSSKPTF